MELRGWLHKRSSGAVKSWKRRFFICDKDCVLRYYKNDPDVHPSDPKGTLQITSFSDNAGRLQKKIPRQFDPNNSLLFTTTDSNKQWFLVVAETVEDKIYWTNGMTALFQPELSLDISSILSSTSTNYGCRFDLTEIINHTDEPGNSSSSEAMPTVLCLPPQAHRLIACCIGDLRSVCLLSMVSKSWHSSLKCKARSVLWTWLVRQGSLTNCTRWRFWRHVIGAHEKIGTDRFNDLIHTATAFNKYEIEKDVNRAFGVSVSKRMTERRYVPLYPSTTIPTIYIRIVLSLTALVFLSIG